MPMDLYHWAIFLHVLGVFGFLLGHGSSAGVAFRLRREKDIERVRALLDLSRGTEGVMYPSLLLVILTGTAAGFHGNWWGQ